MDKKSQFTSPQVVEKIQQFEKNTGYELVVVAAHASDPYPGALWRSSIINTLLIAAIIFQFYTFSPRLIEILIIAGLLVAFYGFFRLTGLHRFFILPSEAERETREKAESLFSRFQSSSLGHEASILLFFSLSEHKMHLLIDTRRNIDFSISNHGPHEFTPSILLRSSTHDLTDFLFRNFIQTRLYFL